MIVAWTTVATQKEADRLATAVVHAHLAACVQIDAPITSCYHWNGKIEITQEIRLTFKCLPEKLLPLETWVLTHHPYSNPEWMAVKADRVSEKYLSWARGDVHSPTL